MATPKTPKRDRTPKKCQDCGHQKFTKSESPGQVTLTCDNCGLTHSRTED